MEDGQKDKLLWFCIYINASSANLYNRYITYIINENSKQNQLKPWFE